MLIAAADARFPGSSAAALPASGLPKNRLPPHYVWLTVWAS